MKRRVKVYDIIITLWIAATLILLSGFFLGFQLGRLKGQVDTIESKEQAEQFIEYVIEETEARSDKNNNR